MSSVPVIPQTTTSTESTLIKTLRTEALQGKADSQYKLGYNLCYGIGVSKDPLEALKWYELAGKQGHVLAWNEIAYIYFNGAVVEKDLKKAREYWEYAAEKGHAQATYNVAYVLWTSEDGSQKQEGLKWYHRSAELGHAESQAFLGYLYLYGIQVEKNVQRALDYLQKALKQQSGYAAFLLGESYRYVDGVDEDHNKAMEMFECAVSLGYKSRQFQAAFELGKLYAMQNNEGLSLNHQKQAAIWYKRAADCGHVQAKHDLGCLYERGFGDTATLKEMQYARKLFEEAAAANNSESCKQLAKYYEMGQGGLEKDQKKAEEWYQKAIDASQTGNFAASEKLFALRNEGKDAAEHHYLQGLLEELNVQFLGGLPPEQTDALSWYQKAANNGLVHAEYRMDLCKAQLQNDIKKIEEVRCKAEQRKRLKYKMAASADLLLRWLSKDFMRQHKKELSELCTNLLRGEYAEKAFLDIKKYCEQDRNQAANYDDYVLLLMYCYFNRIGTSYDLNKTIELCKILLEKKHPIAQSYYITFFRFHPKLSHIKPQEVILEVLSKEDGAVLESQNVWLSKYFLLMFDVFVDDNQRKMIAKKIEIAAKLEYELAYGALAYLGFMEEDWTKILQYARKGKQQNCGFSKILEYVCLQHQGETLDYEADINGLAASHNIDNSSVSFELSKAYSSTNYSRHKLSTAIEHAYNTFSQGIFIPLMGSIKEAYRFFQELHSRCFISQDYPLAMRIEGAEKMLDGLETLKEGCRQGNPLALFGLGYHYLLGIGVKRDTKQAILLFKKASRRGNPDASDILLEAFMQKQMTCTVRKALQYADHVTQFFSTGEEPRAQCLSTLNFLGAELSNVLEEHFSFPTTLIHLVLDFAADIDMLPAYSRTQTKILNSICEQWKTDSEQVDLRPSIETRGVRQWVFNQFLRSVDLTEKGFLTCEKLSHCVADYAQPGSFEAEKISEAIQSFL